MMKSRYYRWLIPLFACLLTACGDDDYSYPPVKLEFLTAFSGADGSLQSVLTDEGQEYAVLEGAAKVSMEANSFTRIVSNYALKKAADGTVGVKLYAVLSPVSPLPLPAEKFKDGIKTDPVELQSIWMGRNYLNILLGIKAQDGKHLLHFIEDRVDVNEAEGHVTVHLTLYHDGGSDVLAYTKRAYVSVPLWQYADEGIQQVTVSLDIHTYSDGIKTYQFDYIPTKN